MNLRNYYLVFVLATFWPVVSLAQSIPNAAPAGIVGQLAIQADGQASAVSKIQSANGSYGSQAQAHVAGEHGPLGIGKPRTFPIIRHLKERHAINKAKFRSSPLAKILDGPRKILSKATGGVVPSQPTPNDVQLAAPGPQGAAAKIKKDSLEAPKRLAAIQDLGTVDCHWYPEALTQLTTALRTDRSECVRFEAAKILSSCNCCSPQLIEALKVCVAGTDTDGNPSERSFRIREQAAFALEACLAGGQNNSFASEDTLGRPEYPDPPSSSPLGTTPGIPASSKENSSKPGVDASSKSADNIDISSQVVRTSFDQPVANSKSQAAKVDVESAYRILDSFNKLKPQETERQATTSLIDIWKKSK